jgi:hypothetical protein
MTLNSRFLLFRINHVCHLKPAPARTGRNVKSRRRADLIEETQVVAADAAHVPTTINMCDRLAAQTKFCLVRKNDLFSADFACSAGEIHAA